MKITFSLISICLLFSIHSKGQVVLQGFLGNEGYEFSSFIQKDISKNQKLSYFGITDYFAGYTSDVESTSEIFQTLNYEVIKNAGISIGGTFTKGELIPQIGLCYGLDKKHFSASLFPGIGYSFRAKEINFSFNSLLEYSPRINDLWNAYGMLVFGSDFNKQEHEKTNEHLRLGLEYKTKFQFGLGLNLEQVGSSFISENTSYGLFAGYTLF